MAEEKKTKFVPIDDADVQGTFRVTFRCETDDYADVIQDITEVASILNEEKEIIDD